MPVTAKLSRKFYEKLGDDVANELAEWLNVVDSSYRSEFRELFEANFGRVEARMAGVEERIAAFESRMAAHMSALEARVDVKLERMKSELLRWMFLFWLGSMGTVLAILKA